MKNEWFAAKELIGIAGLPASTQGINLMARREGWVSRRRKGVQGKALEYHIKSLPANVQKLLFLREEPAIYEAEHQDPLTIWVQYYYHLSGSEREKVMSYLMREGVVSLLTWITEKEKEKEK